MKCKACGTEVPEGATFCTLCGANLETGARTSGEAPDAAVYPLLAAANLFRMRGNWDAAEQKCIEVLRLYPNNATAHSLLGDIYANQGRWEEAIQWYQLAAELDTNNQADRAKLDQAKQRLVGAGAAAEAVSISEKPIRSGAFGRRLTPLLQLTIIALLTFIVVLLRIGAQPKPEEPPLSTAPGVGVALPGSPGFDAARVARPPANAAAPPGGNPSPVPPAGRATPAAPPRNGAPPAPPNRNESGYPTPPGPDMTVFEARALAYLQSRAPQPSSVGSARVTDLRWDPLGSRAVVTVVFASSLDPEVLRHEALRAAYRTGQVLARIDLSAFEIIVKAPMQPGRGPEIVLAAEAANVRPNSWVHDASTARPDVLLTVFGELWWHERFK